MGLLIYHNGDEFEGEFCYNQRSSKGTFTPAAQIDNTDIWVILNLYWKKLNYLNYLISYFLLLFLKLNLYKMENYEVIQVIGSGSSGNVEKIVRKSDKKALVWKKLDYGKMHDKEKS